MEVLNIKNYNQALVEFVKNNSGNQGLVEVGQINTDMKGLVEVDRKILTIRIW